MLDKQLTDEAYNLNLVPGQPNTEKAPTPPPVAPGAPPQAQVPNVAA
jgi:hypothetical protein